MKAGELRSRLSQIDPDCEVYVDVDKEALLQVALMAKDPEGKYPVSFYHYVGPIDIKEQPWVPGVEIKAL